MRSVATALGRFLPDDAGATAIEYGLIAAGVVLGLAVPLAYVAEQMDFTYEVIIGYFESIN